MALIYAHKKCSTVDREAVTALDTKLKDERKRADDQVLPSISSMNDLTITYFRRCIMLAHFSFTLTEQTKPRNMWTGC